MGHWEKQKKKLGEEWGDVLDDGYGVCIIVRDLTSWVKKFWRFCTVMIVPSWIRRSDSRIKKMIRVNVNCCFLNAWWSVGWEWCAQDAIWDAGTTWRDVTIPWVKYECCAEAKRERGNIISQECLCLPHSRFYGCTQRAARWSKFIQLPANRDSSLVPCASWIRDKWKVCLIRTFRATNTVRQALPWKERHPIEKSWSRRDRRSWACCLPWRSESRWGAVGQSWNLYCCWSEPQGRQRQPFSGTSREAWFGIFSLGFYAFCSTASPLSVILSNKSPWALSGFVTRMFQARPRRIVCLSGGFWHFFFWFCHDEGSRETSSGFQVTPWAQTRELSCYFSHFRATRIVDFIKAARRISSQDAGCGPRCHHGGSAAYAWAGCTAGNPPSPPKK